MTPALIVIQVNTLRLINNNNDINSMPVEMIIIGAGRSEERLVAHMNKMIESGYDEIIVSSGDQEEPVAIVTKTSPRLITKEHQLMRFYVSKKLTQRKGLRGTNVHTNIIDRHQRIERLAQWIEQQFSKL